jgi:hypothetical protein
MLLGQRNLLVERAVEGGWQATTICVTWGTYAVADEEDGLAIWPWAASHQVDLLSAPLSETYRSFT